MSESKISCPHCAQHITLDEAWAGQTINCPACQQPFLIPGVPQAVQSAPPPPPPPPPAPGLRMQGAAGSPVPPPPISAGRPGAARPQSVGGPQKTSGLAIASLVLSLLGCFGITALAGIICGHMARSRIRKDPSLGGGGLALAGLIIGYVMFVLTIGWWTLFTVGFMKGFNEARHQAKLGGGFPAISTNALSGEEMVTFDAPEKEKLPAPEGAVSGSIQGQTFTYTKSTLHKGMSMLEVSEGEEFFAERAVKIFLFLKSGESVENRTWKINATGTGMNPHVHLSWKEGDQDGVPKTEIVTSGYQLELKTGAITNDTITGSISLKVTGKTPAELKGNFNARVE